MGQNSGCVDFQTENVSLQRLFDTAVARCKGNLRDFGGRRVLVEGGGYEKIWLETQPMGGEMFAAHDITAATNNQLLFMEGQREDGRLPGSIQCFADGHTEPQYNKLQGFCFPWHALNMYYIMGEDGGYLNALAKCLERFDDYLWRWRDSDGDGCLESFCVYDTGEDAAIRYGNSPVYCATDAPPMGYDVVPMASMDIMSFSYACRDTLREIAQIRRDGKEALWKQKAGHVADKLKKLLWDEKAGACFDRAHNGQRLPQLIHNNLRCMYWGSFSQEMADRFVTEHLLNQNEFWTALPLPSVAANDPDFVNAPENNWSGQVEGLTYQRAILALERYGYEPIVTKLGHKLMDAVIRSDYVFSQQYDPFTGIASRVGAVSKSPVKASDETVQDDYGPTLLAVLGYIDHIYGISRQRNEISFSLGSGTAYTMEQHWNDHSYRIESNGKNARVLIDGSVCIESACGIRHITDADGKLIRTRIIE